MTLSQVQAISLLALPVTLQQDTPAGTWVTANGSTVGATDLPIGVSPAGKKGETVAVTTIGTAGMNLTGIATSAVTAGDVVVYENGSMAIKTAADAIADLSKVRGIVLYAASATSQAEVLLTP